MLVVVVVVVVVVFCCLRASPARVLTHSLRAWDVLLFYSMKSPFFFFLFCCCDEKRRGLQTFFNNLRPPRLWASLTKTLVPLLLRPHTQYSYSYYLNYLTTNDTDNTHHHQKEREEEPPSAERALNREDRARSETSDSSRANREILKKGDDF